MNSKYRATPARVRARIQKYAQLQPRIVHQPKISRDNVARSCVPPPNSCSPVQNSRTNSETRAIQAEDRAPKISHSLTTKNQQLLDLRNCWLFYSKYSSFTHSPFWPL